MAEQIYYMKLTEQGLNAYARAGTGGPSVEYAFVAVGDGNGQAVTPDSNWTALIKEVWRDAPILVEVDKDNPRIVIVEMYIPHNIGGFTVREVGLFASDGKTMLAVGNYPDSYKPTVDDGAGTEMRGRFMIEHANATNTVLKIDPAIVMASREYAERVAQVKIDEHDTAAESHDHLARKSVKIIAGSGLKGGGDLSASRTIALGDWEGKSAEDVLKVIELAGIEKKLKTPEQLHDAIQNLIVRYSPKPVIPDRHDIGQYYWFEDGITRPGMVPCLGGVIHNVSKEFPAMVDYLMRPETEFRCVTQEEWDRLHVATWHTNADGTTVGWEGIGGVNKFVLDLDNDTLRVPDLAGMTREMIGADAFGLSDVHGDAVREATASVTFLLNIQNSFTADKNVFGAFHAKNVLQASSQIDGTPGGHDWMFDLHYTPSRVVPVAEKNQTRAWGSLACVYCGPRQ